MCATPDKAALKERRSRKGPLRGWKVLEPRGGSLWSDVCRYEYVPGVNYPTDTHLKIGGYQHARPRGLHIYRFNDKTWEMGHREVVVPVTYQPSDVIAAENPKVPNPQVVVRKLRISQRAYDAAMKA